MIKDSGTCHISCVILIRTHPSCVFLVWWQGTDESTKAYESMLAWGPVVSSSARCLSPEQTRSGGLCHRLPLVALSAKGEGWHTSSGLSLIIVTIVIQSLSSVWLSVTPWTVALQASLSMGFSRQEYWSGLPFPSPGDLSNPGVETESLALAGRFFMAELPGKPHTWLYWSLKFLKHHGRISGTPGVWTTMIMSSTSNSITWRSDVIVLIAILSLREESAFQSVFQGFNWIWAALLPASQVALVVKNLTANAGDVRDADSIPESGRSPGRGHGNPLQYSCLETPMDRGAWRTTVYGVTKSQTRLKWLSMHAHILPILVGCRWCWDLGDGRWYCPLMGGPFKWEMSWCFWPIFGLRHWTWILNLRFHPQAGSEAEPSLFLGVPCSDKGGNLHLFVNYHWSLTCFLCCWAVCVIFWRKDPHISGSLQYNSDSLLAAESEKNNHQLCSKD